MNNLDANYWEERYQKGQTGWDIGEASRPIIEYMSQVINKDLRILIPGCGNAYEAEYLFNTGFKNVYLIDLAESPLQNFKHRVPAFPENQLILGDIFELNETFDLILEQTLFCAIDPSFRKKYVDKISSLLTKNGKFVGLLFNRTFEGGPPFGGNKQEYLEYFKPKFAEIHMELCHNSIKARTNTELFFIAKK